MSPLRRGLLLIALGLALVSRGAAKAATEVLVQSTALFLRDDVEPPIDLARRTLRFRASTQNDPAPNRIVPPSPGGAGDPMIVGASLVVQGLAGTTDRVQIDLPPERWTMLGSSGSPRGFLYQDRSAGAAVSKMAVTKDLITVRGGGGAFGYSLDEPQQGRVGVRLTMGDITWCAEAPAKPSGNPPSTARSDLPGKFGAQPKAAAPVSCRVGAPAFVLTVTNGYGSGTYAAGSTVHVWAAVRPQDQLVTGWTGDMALLADPAEWHSTLLMPARDTAVGATIVDRPTTLTVSQFTGVTGRPKTVRSRIPPQPRGLVLFLHGTGGGNGFIGSTEAFPVALLALESGYGVLGTEAEEAVAGDLDGDGKERWDAALSASNTDVGNLNALVAGLRSVGTISATTPLFAIGMSNGGSMSVSLGAVSASAVAPLYPELRFQAVVSHCADARTAAVAITATPTGWLLCENDDNANVSNADAIANSATLAGRGIATFVDRHPPSPLYGQRFLRIPGVDLATSLALASELRAAGFVAPDGFFNLGTNAIVTAVMANPALLPTFARIAPNLQREVVDQIRAMRAEHQMYSDWAARAVAFFDAHNP